MFTLVLSAVSNLVGVFPAESFPTEVRASGIGLATAVSRLGSAVSTFLLPVSVAGIGLSPTMGILAAILAIGAIVVVGLGTGDQVADAEPGVQGAESGGGWFDGGGESGCFGLKAVADPCRSELARDGRQL